MIDVVLCKTRYKDPHKEYALMVRNFDGVDTEWDTLCYMDYFSATRLDGEKITFWASDAEETPEVKALRLEHPSLREAWENYKILKELLSKNK